MWPKPDLTDDAHRKKGSSRMVSNLWPEFRVFSCLLEQQERSWQEQTPQSPWCRWFPLIYVLLLQLARLLSCSPHLRDWRLLVWVPWAKLWPLFPRGARCRRKGRLASLSSTRKADRVLTWGRRTAWNNEAWRTARTPKRKVSHFNKHSSTFLNNPKWPSHYNIRSCSR